MWVSANVAEKEHFPRQGHVSARVCFRNPLLGHFPRHISLLFDASECSIVEKMARGNVGECECG